MINATVHRRSARRGVAAAVCALVAIAGAACSAEDPDVAGQQASPEAGSSAEIPKQEVNQELSDQLPADIKKAKKITTVNSGSFPPYEIIQTDGTASGASADLMTAMGELWGVEVEHETVDGLSSVLTGLSSERYQLAFGPIGDFKDRQASNDFVDYVQEFVVFAVPKGNPNKIDGIETTCGLKIAVQAGGSAEKVIKDQAKKCKADGKDPIKVMSFKDQPQSILSVQSGRADAFFSSQAPLTYFVKESNGKLELAGTGKANGFDTLYQGAVVNKGSEMGPVVEESLKVLFENGTYEKIMKKWDLQDNMIDAPGKNLGVS